MGKEKQKTTSKQRVRSETQQLENHCQKNIGQIQEDAQC